MNKKSFSLLVFCMMFIQVVMPNFGATEVEKSYAPVNPTPAQVAAANPTDIVVFDDSNFESNVATELGVEVGSITVNDMLNLNKLGVWSIVQNLSGIEYAQNITELYIHQTQVTDIMPISNLTSLNKLVIGRTLGTDYVTALSNLTNLNELTYEEVYNIQEQDLKQFEKLTNLKKLTITSCTLTDISFISNLTSLENINLSGNQISDISPIVPLLEDEIYTTVNLNGQAIYEPAKIVTTNDEIVNYFTNLAGEKILISLGVPTLGDKYYSSNTVTGSEELLNGKVDYSYYAYAFINYIKFDGLKNASINEEQELTDEELIALFEVVNEANDAITVDASAVNYSTPGEYQVEFSLANGAKLNPTLKVLDIKPTIEISNNIVSIEANSQKPNLIEAFGVTATEITDGDLTANITVDDGAVNYSKAGTYNVKFAVTDPEENPVTKTTKLEITPEQEINVEEKNSEEKIEVNSETTSQKENEEKTTTSEKSESTVAMTDNNKQGLTSTGYRTTILIVALSAIAAILVTLKKISTSKN